MKHLDNGHQLTEDKTKAYTTPINFQLPRVGLSASNIYSKLLHGFVTHNSNKKPKQKQNDE